MRYALLALALLAVTPTLLPNVAAGLTVVREFTGPVLVKHVTQGTVECQGVPGSVKIDLATVAGQFLAAPTQGVADVTLTSGCGSGEGRYVATQNGAAWTMQDVATSVPAYLSPASGGAWKLVLIVRAPTEPQSDFTQATGSALVESDSP